jgi:hypothetical protein
VWADSPKGAANNWGGDYIGSWAQEYFEDDVCATIAANFALEAIALAAMKAAIDTDEEAARRALVAHTVCLPWWGNATMMGLLDPDATLAEIVPA